MKSDSSALNDTDCYWACPLFISVLISWSMVLNGTGINPGKNTKDLWGRSSLSWHITGIDTKGMMPDMTINRRRINASLLLHAKWRWASCLHQLTQRCSESECFSALRNNNSYNADTVRMNTKHAHLKWSLAETKNTIRMTKLKIWFNK